MDEAGAYLEVHPVEYRQRSYVTKAIIQQILTKVCKMREENTTFLKYTTELYRQIYSQMQGLQWKDGGPVVAAQSPRY